MTDLSEHAPLRPRVVIAEDEALIRMDLAEMLEEQGYEVVAQAANGQEAIDAAREHQPDLIVLDIKMPKVDGIAAATVIARERIAPIVMLTAFSQRELIERARDAGAMAYVVKPFGPHDLVPAIELARARFAEIKALALEAGDLRGQLEARKVIERAKSLIQDELGITEAESFSWIQRTAMDLRLSMREVAQSVIDKGFSS